MITTPKMNAEVATRLEEVADLLESQLANPYRVNAYRRAAQTVRHQSRSLSDIVAEKGIAGLDELPGVGESLARTIHQLVVSGKLPMLDRLRGESDPVEILASVPGIGKRLAVRLYEDLSIHSLEELEAAAHDGRLLALEGFGHKRIAGIRDSLASRLGRVRKPVSTQEGEEAPVSEILEIDREYRDKVAVNALPKITPRRFNVQNEAWLPVLHTIRGTRHYTALYSNTARAHQQHRTQDWVVVYYDGGMGERQCTVITANFGDLAGKRIVRGREGECLAFYAVPAKAAQSANQMQ